MNFVTNPALKSWAYLNIGIFMSMINGRSPTRRGMTAVLGRILPNTQAFSHDDIPAMQYVVIFSENVQGPQFLFQKSKKCLVSQWQRMVVQGSIFQILLIELLNNNLMTGIQSYPRSLALTTHHTLFKTEQLCLINYPALLTPDLGCIYYEYS